MRLVVTLGEVELEFVEASETDAPYPWLGKVGALLLNAIAGHLEGTGVDEAPNVPVELDNRDNQATRVLGFPLRAPAVIYGDDGTEFFAGDIATMKLGRTLELSIEA